MDRNDGRAGKYASRLSAGEGRQGVAGIDGMTVDELMPYLREEWAGIKEERLSGEYHPQTVPRGLDLPGPGEKQGGRWTFLIRIEGMNVWKQIIGTRKRV